MVKKSLYPVICLLVLLLGGNVSEAGNFYASGFGGVTFLSDSDITGPIEDEAKEALGGTVTNLSLEQTFDTGFVVGGNVGYDFGYIRAEGEISYRKNGLDKLTANATVDGTATVESEKQSGDVSALSFMANGFLEYDNKSRFTPYAGGGIGLSVVKADNGTSEDDTVFAYQLGAGLAFAATEKITLELSYRFFGTSDPKLGDSKAEYMTHNILLGIRYNF